MRRILVLLFLVLLFLSLTGFLGRTTLRVEKDIILRGDNIYLENIKVDGCLVIEEATSIYIGSNTKINKLYINLEGQNKELKEFKVTCDGGDVKSIHIRPCDTKLKLEGDFQEVILNTTLRKSFFLCPNSSIKNLILEGDKETDKSIEESVDKIKRDIEGNRLEKIEGKIYNYGNIRNIYINTLADIYNRKVIQYCFVNVDDLVICGIRPMNTIVDGSVRINPKDKDGNILGFGQYNLFRPAISSTNDNEDGNNNNSGNNGDENANNENGNGSGVLLGKNYDIPKRIDITTLDYYGKANDNLDLKANFQDYLSDRYQIEFCINSYDLVSYTATISAQMASKDLTGIVSILDREQVFFWADMGYIHSLDTLLSDNETWINIVPQEWKDLYTKDGKVWALPKGSGNIPSWFVRSIRGDWLDYLNLEKPNTISDFYEVSKAFVLNDPNQSGKLDTFGFVSSNTYMLQDIFQAYDVRTNHAGDLLPVWNPHTGKWEDSLVKPRMAEATSFLRKCYLEGLMHPDTFILNTTQARNLVSEGHIGSCFYWDTWLITWENELKKQNPSAYMVGVGALTSDYLSTKLNYYQLSFGYPNVLSIYTQEPKEVINAYVDLVYGSPESFYTFRYGIKQDNINATSGYYLDSKNVYLLYYQYDQNTKEVGTSTLYRTKC